VCFKRDEPKSPEAAGEPFPLSPRTPSQANPAATTSTHDAVIATIERLAELHKKEILSEEEFAATRSWVLSFVVGSHRADRDHVGAFEAGTDA
jgi:hypothetical protein